MVSGVEPFVVHRFKDRFLILFEVSLPSIAFLSFVAFAKKEAKGEVTGIITAGITTIGENDRRGNGNTQNKFL